MESNKKLTILEKQELIRSHREGGVDLKALSRKYDMTLKGIKYILDQGDAIMAVHPLIAGNQSLS